MRNLFIAASQHWLQIPAGITVGISSTANAPGGAARIVGVGAARGQEACRVPANGDGFAAVPTPARRRERGATRK